LKSPDLFIKEAFIDGEWVKKAEQFDVYGSLQSYISTEALP